MKLKWIIVMATVFIAVRVYAAETAIPKTQKEKVSYGLGVDTARTFVRMGIDVDPDFLIQGIRDELSRGALLMTEADLRNVLSAHYAELTRRREEALHKVAAENEKMGEAFLAENRAREGVVTLPSGLQYKVLRPGTGRKPGDADTIECNYRGMLVNGVEFDSSYRTGEPLTRKVASLIPGWREAIKLMPEGSKWLLFIPPQLAFGARQSVPNVGPNSTLILEVELLAIK
jgi:FKBP-type peptidyl-prolyl cis-trans isomerase